MIPRLKHLLRLQYGFALASGAREEGEYNVYGSNGSVGTHVARNTKAPAIIVGRKGSFGKITWAENGGFCIDTAYFVDQRHCAGDLRFSYYVLLHLKLDEHSKDSAVPGLDRSDAQNSEIDIPDLPTQRRIAGFLDRETARIDQLIEKKQRLTALLGEKYKAEKKRFVFALHNQGVERNASAVSWFPDLPSHWLFLRCAHIFKNLDYRRIPLSSEQRGNLAKIYPYYGASGIIDAVDDYLFYEDTILVGEDGANLVMQSTPIAFKASGKYWVNNHAHILTPRFGDFDYWIHALNQVPYEVFVTGSAQPKLTSAVLGNIHLPVPPSNERGEIARGIEAMGQRVNSAIEPIRTSIDRLKEYRSALITAAVTGQIDVMTDAQSGSPDRCLNAIQKEMTA